MDNIGIDYIFDINKIAEFVFGNPNDKTNEIEINENFRYDTEKNKWVPDTKQTTEVKTNDYTGQNNIRYDMIKMFIEILDSVEDTKIMTMSQKLALNTLQAYELIKNINEDGNE